MREPIDPAAVVEVMRRLCDEGAPCLLFGGWAEEAFGLCDPRRHSDIDLLLPARSFLGLDRLIAASRSVFREIPLKRFAHKRAFSFNEHLVEVILVQHAGATAHTLFWGDVRFVWSTPLAETCRLGGHRLPGTSPENLQRYRASHPSIEPWRWKDPASLVPPHR